MSASPLLRRASRRHRQKHPLLTALSVLGIALGVAVVVSIDLANESAIKAFASSRRAVTGEATHQIVAGPAGIPEALFTRLVRELGVVAAPVVEGHVASPRSPGRALLLLGVDVFMEAPFHPRLGAFGRVDATPILTVPASALLPVDLAQRLALTPGGRLPIVIDGRSKDVLVAGTLESGDAASALALADVLVADISTAQELLGQSGRLTRIELMVSAAEGEQILTRVRQLCADRCDVVPAASQSLAATQMTRAFRLNTSALGLLALVVGMFLTYNTMSFFVVERRALLGTLRALGVTRRELFRSTVAEAVILAVPGTVLGMAGGIWLAHALVRLVTRTFNDLYFVVSVRALTLEPSTLAKAIGLGLGATVLSALAPAWEATRVPPGVTLRRSAREIALGRRAASLALFGAAACVVAAFLVLASRHSLVAAFAALFAVLSGAALAAPLAIRALAAVFRPLFGALLGMAGRMAARGMVASLGQSSVAVSALMIAVATTVGLGIMVDSFRAAVSLWLDQTLRSDLFVQVPSPVSRKSEGTLAPEVVRRVAACDGVAAVNTIRNRRVRTDRGEVDLHAPSYGDLRARGHHFRAGAAADVYRALEGDAVAISEPYAFRHDLGMGGAVNILTDGGWRRFTVAGVYADYASDEGGLSMARATYDRYYDDRGVSALGLMARPGVDLSVLRDRVRACAGPEQAVVVSIEPEIKEASLAIFDRTFAVTRALRLLAVLVAFFGILSAVSALALERSRELAVLRAIGMTPRNVRRLLSAHTLLLGLSAGLLSIPLGVVLAFFLVHVINRRSFGWSLELSPSPGVLVQALALSILAALLAGVYPAWKVSRAIPAAALREE